MKAVFFTKALPVALGILFVVVAGPVLGEVTIKHVPMTQEQAAITDGEALYQELCAVCHGDGAMGDGPAISALNTVPSNLTVISLQNSGAFPREEVETMLAGRYRDESHFAECGMPSWYRAFSGVHPDWKLHRRHAFAMTQIGRLTDYLETIQVDYAEHVGP